MKKILFFLLGIALFICAIDASLDFFYFTGPGKVKAIELLSQKLNSEVKIEKLKFRVLTGFSLKNVHLKDAESETSLLKIDHLKARLDYLALFSKKIKFKDFQLVAPSLTVSPTLKKKLSALTLTHNKKSADFIINHFHIKQGSFKWDKHHIKDISAKIKILPNHEIEGSFSGLLDTPSKPPALFETNLSWIPETKSITLIGSSTFFPLEILQPYIKKDFSDLKGLAGKADLSFELTSRIGETLKFKTHMATPSFQLALTPWQWEGPIQIQATAIYNFLSNKWDYKGEVETQKGNFYSSLLPSDIKQIEGKFLFENNFITTNGVEGYYDNKSVRARGSFEKSEKPIIHATLYTDLEPEKFTSIAKIIRPAFFENFSITGKSFTQFYIHTNETTKELDWEGTIYLKEALFQLNKHNLTYSNLNGAISFTEEKLQFKNIEGELSFGEKNRLFSNVFFHGDWSLKDEKSILKAEFKEGAISTPWLQNPITQFQSEILITPTKMDISSFSGKTFSDTFQGNASIEFKDIEKPEISFYLSSPEYSLLFQGAKGKDKLHINKLNGYGFGTSFDISGEVPFSSNDFWNITLEGKVDTITLKKAWPILWEKANWLNIWNPKGSIEVKGDWRGKPKENKTWHANALFFGSRVEIKNLFFDDFQMQYHLQNKVAEYKNIKGVLKEGRLTADLVFDFNNQPSTYSIELEAQDLDIINIPLFFNKETDNFTLQGPFYGKLLMKGVSGQSDKAIGVAKLSIRDGKLWDSPLLKPVWITIRNFSPKLEKPVFKSVEGDFKIGNNLMQTDNLELKSPGLILMAEGNISFDQAVDMLFKINFIEPEGTTVKVLAAKGLNFFGKFLEIEYKGTLSEPVVNRRWLPLFKKKDSDQKELSLN